MEISHVLRRFRKQYTEKYSQTKTHNMKSGLVGEYGSDSEEEEQNSPKQSDREGSSGDLVAVSRSVDPEVVERIAKFEKLAEEGKYFFDSLVERPEFGNLASLDRALERIGIDPKDAVKSMALHPSMVPEYSKTYLDLRREQDEGEELRSEAQKLDPSVALDFESEDVDVFSGVGVPKKSEEDVHHPPKKIAKIENAIAIAKARAAALQNK